MNITKNLYIPSNKNKFKFEYIPYNSEECPDKYIEINEYLKNVNYIPPRLSYKDKSQYKKIQKKRAAFRSNAKEKYFIKDNWMYYEYKEIDKTLELKIPFINEMNIIIKNIHINNKHAGERKMRKYTIDSGFIYSGYSTYIKNFIKNCQVCCSSRNINKIKMPIKQILDQGPHFRYEVDIWYLDEKLKTNNNYNYCLDLIDHFSKYIYSYLLANKTMELVVSKIKLFILIFGKCKIFQTENGLEFKN